MHSTRYRLRCDNPHLDGIVVTVIEVRETYTLVATGVGSGEYRAAVHELEELIKLNGSYVGETCVVCGSSNLTWAGSCKRCENCGETTGCT